MKDWWPLERADVQPITPKLLEDAMRAHPFLTRESVIELLERESAKCEYWINPIYQVAKTYEGEFVHLNIRRRDGAVIYRDWRHFQEIKNQLLGPECEAVELYPAEGRLVDTSNKYHLFGRPDPDYRFPFGYQERDVQNHEGQTPGTRQRAR